MKDRIILLIFVAFCQLLLPGFRPGPGDGILLTSLKCEMLVDPQGIDIVNPRLSWEITGDKRGIQQVASHIMVASSKEKLASGIADIWNSGKVMSDQSVWVSYAGKPLRSRTVCYWKVKVWTNKGESPWSQTARWSMGLLNYVDWNGRWIGLDHASSWDSETLHSRLSARYFRKEFRPERKVLNATAHIIGLGMYELYINGNRIGNDVLAPVPTDYTKGIKYNVFDVTSSVKEGANAIGVVLGNGRFYNMRQHTKPYKIKTFGYPKMLFQLDIQYEDGTRSSLVSDESWKVTADGPIRTNNEYDGEEYDAQKEMQGWNKAGFADESWQPAELVQEPGGNFEAQMNPNMKVMQVLKPLSLNMLNKGTWILDMGQNMAGWLKIRVNGKKGDTVTLRFAETLQADGSLYRANLRDAKVTDKYILKGEGTETWEPSFVYHGFRYVEINGFPGTPAISDFEGKVIYDEMQTVGSFETSDKTINQVYRNAYWGIRSNYKGMPVDCPQRNERQPWLGDRTTGAYGESFIFGNDRLYAKWLDDIEQTQKADGSIPDVAPAYLRYYGDDVTWPGTYLTVADMLYRQFGDIQTIRDHYNSMKKWMDYMRDNYMEDFLITKDRYGDWCVPPESPELIHSRDPLRNTDGTLIATATYYNLLNLMQLFAKLANHPGDATEYAGLSVKIKDAFNKKYLNTAAVQYDNNSVTANLLPLWYGLVPKEYESRLIRTIDTRIRVDNNGHISTGVIGTQCLMRGLTAYGMGDLALKIATNRDYPGWGYMAENGATTIWELWNGNTANPEMNSHNHVMLLGDLVIWYYENLAGIKSSRKQPGFRLIEMKPSEFDRLSFVNASYHSPYGLIGSSWKKEGNRFEWEVTVPANSKALIYIPAVSANKVTENGREISVSEGIKFMRMETDRAVFEVGSGNYKFSSVLMAK